MRELHKLPHRGWECSTLAPCSVPAQSSALRLQPLLGAHPAAHHPQRAELSRVSLEGGDPELQRR